MRWIFAGALALLIGCSSGRQPESSSPRGDPSSIPDAWRACSADEECTGVDARCCACGQGDYVGVHRDHRQDARDALEPTECGPCPAQDCPPLRDVCRDGRCAVVDE